MIYTQTSILFNYISVFKFHKSGSHKKQGQVEVDIRRLNNLVVLDTYLLPYKDANLVTTSVDFKKNAQYK